MTRLEIGFWLCLAAAAYAAVLDPGGIALAAKPKRRMRAMTEGRRH